MICPHCNKDTDDTAPLAGGFRDTPTHAPWEWMEAYRVAWQKRHGSFYGKGAADGRALGTLRDLLLALPVAEQERLWSARDGMFTLFLRATGTVAEAKHPFSWFVGRWNQLQPPKCFTPRAPTFVPPKRRES